jgi:hypothetical protein
MGAEMTRRIFFLLLVAFLVVPAAADPKPERPQFGLTFSLNPDFPWESLGGPRSLLGWSARTKTLEIRACGLLGWYPSHNEHLDAFTATFDVDAEKREVLETRRLDGDWVLRERFTAPDGDGTVYGMISTTLVGSQIVLVKPLNPEANEEATTFLLAATPIAPLKAIPPGRARRVPILDSPLVALLPRATPECTPSARGGWQLAETRHLTFRLVHAWMTGEGENAADPTELIHDVTGIDSEIDPVWTYTGDAFQQWDRFTVRYHESETDAALSAVAIRDDRSYVIIATGGRKDLSGPAIYATWLYSMSVDNSKSK